MPMTFGATGEDSACVLTQSSGGLATHGCMRNHSLLRIGSNCSSRRESLLETWIQERNATGLTDSTKVQQSTSDGPWQGIVESCVPIHRIKGARAYASD